MTLGTLIHGVLKTRAQDYHVIAICLDIKAAYDFVCPDILISKFASLGIRGKTCLWLQNFTHGRLIQIIWKMIRFVSGNCSHEIPQGSVLSPILFLICMMDIAETLEEGVFMIVYADDIVTYAIDKEDVCFRQKKINTLDKIKT